MFTHLKNLLALFSVLLLVYSGCNDDDPASSGDPGPGEEELITTVTLTLTDASDANNIVTVQWRDDDGPGGNDPVIGTLTLMAGTTYNGSIQLLNEQENPAENITEEVEEESDAHQFFYTAEGDIAARVAIAYTDQDGNGLPVGLSFTVTVSAGGAVSGTLNVVLSHFDEIAKDGTSKSNETDVDIDLPVNII
jgi:hypothetical protein